jgi:hypothetical protein
VTIGFQKRNLLLGITNYTISLSIPDNAINTFFFFFFFFLFQSVYYYKVFSKYDILNERLKQLMNTFDAEGMKYIAHIAAERYVYKYLFMFLFSTYFIC